MAALTLAPQAFGWSNSGHQAIIAIAFQFDSTLRSRVESILQNLPSSHEWTALEQSGPATGVDQPKPKPDTWAKLVEDQPDRAGTFLDWAQQFKAYQTDGFGGLRTYGLNYDMGQPTFAKSANALTQLQDMEQQVKTGSGGSQAWALLWVLALVSDLHQPLYTTFRDEAGKCDEGGLLVNYRGKTLRQYWDDLPNQEIGTNPEEFARQLYHEFRMESLEIQDRLNSQASDLDPSDWAEEGRSTIRSIGYPADKKVDVYGDAALKISNDRMLLAGARLAALLNKLLQ